MHFIKQKRLKYMFLSFKTKVIKIFFIDILIGVFMNRDIFPLSSTVSFLTPSNKPF